MNRPQRIKELFLILLVISIGSYATPIKDIHTKTSITGSSVDDATTEVGTGTPKLLYEEGTTNTQISSESQTTIDTILAEETITYSRFATPPSQYEQYTTVDEDPDGPTDHTIPYSEHEDPKEVPTKPNYTGPGTWAKPAKDKNIPLEFVPTKLYAQVRGTHTVKRVPQEEARKSAQSDEEKENASRLREVVKNSKVNTVYTEEGYEDSAYDHAGHIRDADFHEGYARKLHEQADVKKKAKDSQRYEKEKKDRQTVRKKPKEFDDYNDDYSEHYESTTPRMELKKLSQRQRIVDEINPKLVTENGIEELERELQKEVLAVEAGVEFNKVPSAELRNNQSSHRKGNEASRESNEDHSRERPELRERVNKKSSSSGDRESKILASIDRDIRKENSVPIKNGNISQKTKLTNGYYDNYNSEKSPYSDASIHDVPTTMNYGQVFWDFFKSQDQELTTQIPIKEPLTTLGSITQTTLPAQVIGNQELHSHSRDQQFLTTPSAVEFSISRLKESLSQPIANEPYSDVSHTAQNLGYISFPPSSEQHGQSDSWRPLSPSEALVNTHSASSNIVTHSQATAAVQDSESGTPSTTTIEYSPEEAEGNAGDSHTGAKIRPRYKMLLRYKPKKGSSNRGPKQGSPSSNSGKEVHQAQSPRTLNSNHQHAKVLNYIRNGNTWNIVDLPTHTRVHNQKHKTTLDDVNKLRPAYPQGFRGIPFDFGQPTITLESESPAEANWHKAPGQQYPGLNDFNRQSSIYQAPFPIIEPVILTQQGASFPSAKLLPPARLTSNDYSKYQPRSLAPKFRSVAYDGTLFGRKRRSTDEFQSSSVKAVEPVKNGLPNRSSIEWRARKNPTAARTRRTERNSWRKALDTQMGREFVLNTSGEPVPATEKRFRLHMKGNEGKNLSVKSLPKQSRELIIDRESTVTNDGKNEGTSESAEEIVKSQLTGAQSPSGNSKREKNAPVIENVASLYKAVVKRDVLKRSPAERKSHKELLDESPRITEEVIDKEIDSRFNDKDETNESEGEEEEKKGKVEVEIPNFDYVEELAEDDHVESTDSSSTTAAPLNTKKYPFYKDDRVSSPALKYAIDPQTRPRKTAGGMEFYSSRDKYKECSEVEPSLDEVLPEEDGPQSDRDLKENQPRLRGLGDKLDCFKAKYFDENPFDNPLFAEKEIAEPTQPVELDPKGFASRIMILPEENEDYVVQKSSRKPENENPPSRKPTSSHAAKGSNTEVPNKFDPRKERGRNTQHNRPRSRNKANEATIKQSPFTVVEPPRLYPGSVQLPRRRPGFPITENPIINSVKSQDSRNQGYSNAQEPRRKPPRFTQFGVPAKITGQKGTPVSMRQPLLYPMTPYESQVYEDVMGNIRHMASSYKVYEDLQTPSNHAAITLPSKTEPRPAIPALNYYKEGNQGGSRDVTNWRTDVEDSIPPQYTRSHPRTLKRNRSQQDLRTTALKSSTDPRVIGHYQTIRIHKRSVDNKMFHNKSPRNSTEKVLVKKRRDLLNKSLARLSHLVGDKRGNVSGDSINKDISTPFAEQRSKRRAISRNDPADDSARTDNTGDDRKSERVTYTIKDRVRYSRPKEEITKVGKFSANETLVDEDHRRKEPRYNHARRRKQPIEQKASFTSVPEQLVLKNKSSALKTGNKLESQADEPSYTRNKQPSEVEETENYNYSGEILKITPRANSESNLSNTSSKHSPQKSSGIKSRRPEKGYAVYEKTEDDDPVSTKENHPVNTSDPPKIEKGEEVDKTEEEHKSVEDTESSEVDDSSNKDRSSEKTFFWYNSRPSSPAENYEDDRFEDLGPRINKPEFYHPPFFVPRLEKLKDTEEENYSEEEGERKSDENSDNAKYDVFPWFRDIDDKDIRSRYKIDSYEFPWEKRNRLLGKQKQNEKGRHKKLDLYDDDDDSEDSVSETDDNINRKNRERQNKKIRKQNDEYNSDESESYERNRSDKKNKENRKEKYKVSDDSDEEDDSNDSVSDGLSEYIYPWDKGRSRPRKGRRSTWKITESDSDSSSSETRPVMRYSSRYRSKELSPPANDKSLAVAANSVHEIIEPINQAINNTVNHSVSSETTDSGVDQKTKIAKTENTRGISRGMIVPEHVTLAPRRIENKQFAARSELLKNESSESRRSKLKKYSADIDSKEGKSSDSENKSQISNTISKTETLQRRRRPLKASSSSSTISNIIETSTESPSAFNNRSRRRQKATSTTSTASPSFSSITSTAASTEKIAIAMPGEPRKRKEEDASTAKKTNGKKPREHRSRTTRRKIDSSTISPSEEVNNPIKGNTGTKKVSKRIRTVIRRKIHKPGKEIRSMVESVKEVPMREGKGDGKTNRSAVIERHEVKMTYVPASLDDEESSTTATIQSKRTKIRESDVLDSLALEDKSKGEIDKKRDNVINPEIGFAPANNVVKLSEHTSREVVSAVSWMSEKYSF